MNELIIIGCGGHTKSIIDIVESTKKWKIKGLISKKQNKRGSINGYKIIGSDEELELISKKYKHLLIGIGQIGLDDRRIKILEKINNLNFNFPIIKSKYSIISKKATFKEGTTVGHGAIINTGAKIGRHCIINSGSIIEHDAEIGDLCHVSTGVIINGDVKIGAGSFIGSGSIIREGLTLPPKTIISAGKRLMGWPNKI